MDSDPISDGPNKNDSMPAKLIISKLHQVGNEAAFDYLVSKATEEGSTKATNGSSNVDSNGSENHK